MSEPTQYIHPSPTDKTVQFANQFIDIRRLADEEGFNYTYLSHIFSANSPKIPNHKTGQLLADALGMEYGDFVRELFLKKTAKTEQ